MRSSLQKGSGRFLLDRSNAKLPLTISQELASFVLAYRRIPVDLIGAFLKILPSDVNGIILTKSNDLYENTGKIVLPKSFPYLEHALDDEEAAAIADPWTGTFISVFLYNFVGMPVIPDFLAQLTSIHGQSLVVREKSVFLFIDRLTNWMEANYKNIHGGKLPLPLKFFKEVVVSAIDEGWRGNRLLTFDKYGIGSYNILCERLRDCDNNISLLNSHQNRSNK